MNIVWGRYLITLDGERRILDDAGVAIDALRRRFPDATETGGPRHAVLPALVNAHMHLSCSLYRGYIADLPQLEHDVHFLFPG